MSFAFAQPTEWWTEIPPDIQTQCWQKSQILASPTHRQEFYLNQLCLNVFLPWFQREYAPEASIWPDRESLLSIWELVGGSSLTLGTKRLVLIPTDTLDSDGLDVPQEWVDIPSWTADYYLAVQVDLENRWIRVWAYTTHQTLKQRAYYDALDHTYCLQSQELARDLNAFWQTIQRCPDTAAQAVISPLPPLSHTQAHQTMQKLSQPDRMFPRLTLPFECWGAFLERSDWRQQLYQKRLVPNKVTDAQSETNLNQWFQNLFANEWQSLEAVLSSNYPTFAHNFRRARDTKGFCAPRVKFITLNAELEPQTVALLMVLNSEADSRMGVRVQVHAAVEGRCVPKDLVLSIYSKDDEILQSIQARGQEDYMRLPHFRCLPSTQFRLKISLNEDAFSETFSV